MTSAARIRSRTKRRLSLNFRHFYPARIRAEEKPVQPSGSEPVGSAALRVDATGHDNVKLAKELDLRPDAGRFPWQRALTLQPRSERQSTSLAARHELTKSSSVAEFAAQRFRRGSPGSPEHERLDVIFIWKRNTINLFGGSAGVPGYA